MDAFYQEIMDQPHALRQMLHHYVERRNPDFDTAGEWLRGAKHAMVIFTGMASSAYSCYPAVTLLNRHGIPSSVWDASELLHYNLEGLPRDALLVAVSQSGESAETVEVVRQLRHRMRILGVTNQTNSFIARNSDLVVPLHAGTQTTVGTKTNTVTIALLNLLAYAAVQSPLTEKAQEIYSLVEAMVRFLSVWKQQINPLVDWMSSAPYAVVMGRGPSLASALLTALVLKEAALIPTEAMSTGEFRHGPLEIVSPAYRFVVLAPEGPTRELSLRMVHDILDFGGEVLVVTNLNDLPREERLRVWLTSRCSEYFFPVPSLIPFQLLAHRIAETKGIEPGKLTKSRHVTTEE